MMDTTQFWLPVVYGHAQSIQGQAGVDSPGQGITDSLFRIDVQNDRQINKTCQDSEPSILHDMILSTLTG